MRAMVQVLVIGAFLAAAPGCAKASAPAAPQTPAATAAPAPSADARPKMVCKRVPVVGSNVGTERVCVPRTDSQKPSDARSGQAGGSQGGNGASNGN